MIFGLRSRGADPVLLALLEESGRNVERASLLLRDLLADFPDRAELARELLVCEQAGDRITHDIIHRLGRGGPRRRLGQGRLASGDVYDLARALDDIVDFAEEAADALGVYGVEAPMEQAQQQAGVLVEASREVGRALATLPDAEGLAHHLIEIHRLENDGDRIIRDAIGALFHSGTDPMVVIRWKDILGSLEQAIDSCEEVAHLLEGMSLRLHR
ncbi:MAG: DUF47 family protein [Thermoleophilaceae bacterium]|nr:DUF47 family protein [Thermoleophilaceae bacterium]